MLDARDISLFDLFKVGIGPSSSHTVGPMVAARRFLDEMLGLERLPLVRRLRVDVYGSLALTGIGHGTDKALILGLAGFRPDSTDPDQAAQLVDAVAAEWRLPLAGSRELAFEPDRDIVFNRRKRLPFHSNGMMFSAFDAASATLASGVYYSIGGGFVLSEAETQQQSNPIGEPDADVPFPFKSGRQLLELGRGSGLRIAEMVRQNERVWRRDDEINEGIDRLWSIMEACIDRGCNGHGLLPGRLKVSRRAGVLYRRLSTAADSEHPDPMSVLDWINLWAMAVNEENAAGGRVVTAPTNGAAGVVPAVLRYYLRFCRGANADGVRTFFLTAAAVAALYKQNASLSGAEVGCQGEVGVACSMAAAGLTATLGGTNEQVENAAEIGMEHNLGLTCDPIGGLVQIPCIERNAMGAVKAIDASRMAMLGDGTHKVSLDKVIATMRQTGADMKTIYKETSRGGLAVNVVEC